MGNDKGDSSERPVHRVKLNQFALGQYEITVAQWKSCVAAKRCEAISQIATSPDATPMHNLSWDDAAAYVEWLSERTGKHYRLPSEAEWEYAARAGTGAAYWWGEGESAQYASCKDCGGTFGKLAPPSAADLLPNPFGLVGMNGGVSEWVADCWKPTYDGAPKDGSARALGNCSNRVLRGGSWRNDHKHITATMRGFYDHDVRYLDNGFRVARDLD
jgi:formylglycine-generating enzyme required for sulfatase activity